MKRSQVPKQAPLLEDRAFVAVVSNVPVPQLAPRLGTIIPSWLIAGIVVDASGLFFQDFGKSHCDTQLSTTHD
jgi:hypothetical protein